MKHLKQLLVVLIFLTCLSAKAIMGDTTHVRFHNKRDMTTYGNYDFKGKFPDQSKRWHQVLMIYTLGCASTGCSGWDYTTHIQYRKPTGNMDSSIAKIDTSQGFPDTIWKRFEVMENFELARVITPYGTYMRDGSNGFNNNWTHRHAFDVTDFAELLHDSATLRAFYSGWSSGFSVTLDFYFIEGTPPRDVLKMQNIYGAGGGSYGYKNSQDFESKYMNAKRVFTPSGMKSAKMSFIPSGHGGDNDQGAAEFYNVGMGLKVNGIAAGSHRVWKADCGKNPLWPQGGTWIFDRANWCPGSRVPEFDFEIGSSLKINDSNTLDMDFEDYTWSGNQTPSYSISSVLWHYGDWNFKTDAALTAIISPSDHEEYNRENPICSNPEVLVKNNGKDDIATLAFRFGMIGGDTQTYNWTGKIGFGEERRLALPMLNWSGFNAASQNTFWCKMETVNGLDDEFPADNQNHSTCKVPEKQPAKVVVWFRTNRFGKDNSYTFTDLRTGQLIYKKENLDSFVIYRDTISLPNSCIEFKLNDAGGDGIDFWWNRQQTGVGYCRFRDMNAKQIKNLNPDFGSELIYRFTTTWGLEAKGLEVSDLQINLYPNPANNLLYIDLSSLEIPKGRLQVSDLLGRTVLQKTFAEDQLRLPLDGLSKGVYIITLQTEQGIVVKKFVKE